MAAFGTNFNPASVMLGRGPGPYIWSGPSPSPARSGKPPAAASPTGSPMPSPALSGSPASLTVPNAPAPQNPGNILTPEAIRATGSGPFDAAYRQNLATYAGGQFQRPAGGNLSFNPTDLSTFPGLPTGGGSAPISGMPSTLLDQALSGQGFNWTPPPQVQTATSPGDFNSLQDWLDQFLRNGRGGRMESIV